jgi:trehalose synthase
MWKQRPVIASRIGGIRDQIHHEQSGILISDPLDLSEVGSAVRLLLTNAERAAQIGRAARDSVQHHFLGPHHLGRYFEVIRRLVGQQEASA